MRNEFLWRFIWILVVTSAVGYAAYLFFGSIVQAQTEPPMEVDVYDYVDVQAHTHRLSGIIMLPTKCHTIVVKTKELGPGKYHLYFSTFGDEHGCAPDPQPVAFRTVIDAPLVGVRFSATLDWMPIDFKIVSEAHS
ncbi:hypothetical protein A2765_00815 [Candidatus Kaiserbacteria bacterium RIFCSPHIGHO2_01_FULL_56_24]|uniref:Uncharacterized protein n=1 Tax=Candidatus Kaiserbacteria bacterium RIFCSPHIGHO2_01_FULL_56_24 TaxID=1798487 RepID=A0A1F6DG47_9BACT|nr:MAG: hypothetical protein A2765_00815 [Candidatus Kaiserbacteria bacterium RIFCSPHIGHO2_01_FULL_56_24]